MTLIDTHLHLDFSQFDSDREALIQRAIDHNICAFVVPATTRASWAKVRSTCLPEHIYPAYGLHPYFIAEHQISDLSLLENWIRQHHAIAIGEIGLDFYLPELDKSRQRQFFHAQLELAQQYQLGVILHARKAVEEVTQALKQHNISGGIVHSFNGSEQQAAQLIALGFKLGFGGAITYPRASRLRRLVASLPLNAIVLETDAPDQRPYGSSEAPNSPMGLIKVFDTLCTLRPESSEHIAQSTTQNAIEAFPDLALSQDHHTLAKEHHDATTPCD